MFYFFGILLVVFIVRADTFTIVALPDPQYANNDLTHIFEEQATWICNNKEKLEIIFTTVLGDIVHQRNDVQKPWVVARRAMDILEKCGMLYSVLPGNHDSDENGYVYYDKMFPSLDGNTFPLETRRNSFYTIPEKKLLFLSLEYLYGPALNYTDSLLEWANQVITEHNEWTVFVSSHYVASDCTDQMVPYIQQLMYDHCNIAMSFGGHVYTCEGERAVPMIDSCGRTKYSLVSNYQYRVHGGDGYLRFYNIYQGTLCAYTYSSRTNLYELADKSWFSLIQGFSKIGPGCLRPGPNLPLSGYVPPPFYQMFIILITLILSTLILVWSSIV